MNHTQQLAWIKLRETQRQRDRLQQQYDAIEQRVTSANSALERLRALYQGLREVTFAQKPLHPDVKQLDALYLADELGEVPPELIADRTRFLERELAQGRMRAEFTYAFGRILSEWTGRGANEAPALAESETDPFARMWDKSPPLDHESPSGVFEGLRGVLRPKATAIAEFARSEALAPVRSEEVPPVLDRLASDPYLAPALRRQAAEARRSATQLTELAGALTILLNSLDEWDWPDEVPSLRAVWVRVKHRPYLDADLITSLFLEIVGLRWAQKLKPLLAWATLYEDKVRFFRPEPPDSLTAEIAEERLREQAARFLATMPTGGRASPNYNGYALLDLLLTVEREMRFARAAHPETPLYVVQADLRDYYPSLSHELILEVLGHLGVPARWRAFFGKVLQPHVRYRGQTRQIHHGLPLDHVLADLFAELVLWVLDLHVYRTTGIQLLRTVDDMCFLTDSAEQVRAVWGTIQAFCGACGLAVNEAKSGAVCLGGRSEDSLTGLPPGGPRWGLLRLQADGTWAVDEPALQQLEETLRKEAAASRSVLSLVARYNSYLQYILGQLALPVTLRGNHLRRVGQRLNRMHEELFGPKNGLVEEVGRRLRDCFADARLKERGLPHALLYWPITAGGLALAHPLLHVASYLDGQKQWKEPRPPSRDDVATYLWRRKADARKSPLTPAEREQLGMVCLDAANNTLTRAQLEEYLRARGKVTDPPLPEAEEIDVAMSGMWAWYYVRVVSTTDPTGPPELAAMERLVKDFIERGSEVSGRGQFRLSPYWRWVVYTYGPSLLEALGTFRFLLTELVPLQLILENRGLAAPAAESDNPDEQPPDPPDPGSEIPF
ncbi:MAG TPA: reverse transcriptase domain-containing protein [Gemmataceae bacterium]|nr:reverse transcriptase domain-containing protein [Gemmataceae bacterium]